MSDVPEFRCVNGHDRCDQMYPGPDCPYCERRSHDDNPNGALLRRIETLAYDLQVIEGMTRRGAVLPAAYRETTLVAMRNAYNRLWGALYSGKPVTHPWSREQEKTDGQ